MKRILTSVFALVLLLSTFQTAKAVDIKLSGWITTLFAGYDSLNLTEENIPGQSNSGFDVYEQFVLNLNAAVSENLSALLRMHAPHRTAWGMSGFGIGGGNVLDIKEAKLNWKIPETNTSVVMGLQLFRFPSMMGVTFSPVFDEFAPGVFIKTPINDNITATASWIRTSTGKIGNGSFRLDDMYGDVFFGSLDMNYAGLKVQPWAAYAKVGSGKAATISSYTNKGTQYVGSNYVAENTFWLALSTKYNNQNLTLFGDILWARGTGGDWTKKGELEFDSLVGALAVEYATDYGTPRLFGWYATGDTYEDISKGKSRLLPAFFAKWGYNAGLHSTAFYGQHVDVVAPTSMVGSPKGSFAFGLAWRNYQVTDKIKLGGSVAFINGTNDKEILQKLPVKQAFTPLYMSTGDNVTVFTLFSDYNITKGLKIHFDINYMLANIDDTLYSTTSKNGFRSTMSFKYSF